MSSLRWFSWPVRLLAYGVVFVALPLALAESGKSGFALVKPQAWSPEDQVTIMEFLSFQDRSVKTSPGAGYFDFRTAKSPSVQVPAARLVKLVIFPDVPVTLMSKAQRAELQKVIEDFESISGRIAGARKMLEPSLLILKADAAKYDAGNLKEDGVWTPRSTYYKNKAAAVIELLRPELQLAKSASEFDLESDQYFLGLQDLAAEEPTIQPMVESMRALHEAAKRKEARADLIVKLKARGLEFADAEALVVQLKTMKPEEDPAAAVFLKSWDSSLAAAGGVRVQIAATTAAFEGGMATPTDGEVAVVSEAVAEQVRATAAAVELFRAGNPPASVKIPSAVSDAMAACVTRLPSVRTQVKARQFLEAKTILDPLVESAPQIGPNTVAALGVLQRTVTTQIERFRTLRDEAKMLADSDKIEAAIKKYEEAFATIPEKEIAVQIEALKKQ